MRYSIFVVLLFSKLFLTAQIVIGTVPYIYTQNFGNSDITTWVDNTTFTGWYIGAGTWNGHANIVTPGGTSLATLNAGGYFNYECNNDNDQKIGSRASGSAPTCNYGVVFRNLTGGDITNIFIRYKAFQFTLAQNNNNPNTLSVQYLVNTVLPVSPVTTGVFTTISAAFLNYTAPQSDPGPGTSNQLSYIFCTESSLLSFCLDLSSTPLLNNQFITIRWNDINDPANDHNLGIDDVALGFYNVSCVVGLTDDDIVLNEKKNGDKMYLNWETKTSEDFKKITLEKSADGINFVSVMDGDYTFTKYEVSNGAKLYYRIKGLKWDESEKISNTLFIQNNEINEIAPVFIEQDGTTELSLSNDEMISELKIYNMHGALIYENKMGEKKLRIDNTLFDNKPCVFHILPKYHPPIIKKHMANSN